MHKSKVEKQSLIQRICNILYSFELWNMYLFFKTSLLWWQVIFLEPETLIWDKEGFRMKNKREKNKETGISVDGCWLSACWQEGNRWIVTKNAKQ